MKTAIDYRNNPVYSPRMATDTLFEIPFTAESTAVPFETVRFLENKQLLRTDLWELFVRQFAIRPDAVDSGWRGEYWGKMMRAACFCARLTGNKVLYATLEKTVLDVLATADADGRISSYIREDEFKGWDMWSRKYILLGCEYFWDICENEQVKDTIVKGLCGHLDYIIDHIGEGEDKRSILDTSAWWGCINSCSILEPVMRLYNITKKPEYLAFADYIVSTGGSNLGNMVELALKNEILPYQYPVIKAYETMSFFEGLLEYYRVTGKEDYKTAVVNFVDRVLDSDYTIIGNCGCTHELFDNSNVKQTEPNPQVAQETCVAVTLSKILYQVYCVTGDPKYADAMERTYYNCILGSVNFEGNVRLRLEEAVGRDEDYSRSVEFCKKIGGFAFDSYAPLYKSRRNRAIGGYKDMENGTAYGCCACIGAAGAALLPLTAVMAAKDGIVLNQYMDGTFRILPDGKNEVTVTMKTRYPYEGRVLVEIENPAKLNTVLKLRIPAWSDANIAVDGQKVFAKAGTFCEVKLNKASVALLLDFDTTVHTVVLNKKVAVEQGCIVLAADNRCADPDTVLSAGVSSVQEAKTEFASRTCVDVTFDNGAKVRLVDYASAGSNWDSEDTYMTAWFDSDIR